MDLTWINYVIVAIFVGASGSITYHFLKTIFEDHRQIGEIEQKNEERYRQLLSEIKELKEEKLKEIKDKVDKIEKSLEALTDSLNDLENKIIRGEK